MDFVYYNKQEKRLRVNVKLKKLQEKVKEQQEKVGVGESLFFNDHSSFSESTELVVE